jgi:Inner membrane protein YgaP-like, transmembrane domain
MINSNQNYRRKNMNSFVKFMASPAGRITRIVAGIILITLGLLVVHGVVGIILAVVGPVPLLAGLFDFCVLAPIFGASLGGKQIRSAK